MPGWPSVGPWHKLSHLEIVKRPADWWGVFIPPCAFPNLPLYGHQQRGLASTPNPTGIHNGPRARFFVPKNYD